MSDSDAMDRFQEEILGRCRDGGDVGSVMAAARAAAPDDAIQAWVAQWDDDMVALAVELVTRWAVADEP